MRQPRHSIAMLMNFLSLKWINQRRMMGNDRRLTEMLWVREWKKFHIKTGCTVSPLDPTRNKLCVLLASTTDINSSVTRHTFWSRMTHRPDATSAFVDWQRSGRGKSDGGIGCRGQSTPQSFTKTFVCKVPSALPRRVPIHYATARGIYTTKNPHVLIWRWKISNIKNHK